MDSTDPPARIDDMWVLEENAFEDTRLYVDDLVGSTYIEIALEDSSGAEISRKYIEGYSTRIAFEKGISNVKVLSGSSVMIERLISFCNNNGKCEPCEGPSCSLIENTLTCHDCKSGSADGFCDTISDDICDPDCDHDTADPDCQSNCSEDCGMDIDTALFCSDYKGTACETYEDCIGGFMVYAADAMTCCLGGVCGIEGEYVETSSELKSHPEYTITPNGKSASAVESQGVDSYCVNSMKGVVCDTDETCNGNSVEFYLGIYCCLGTCTKVQAPPVVSEPEFSAAELESLYDFSEMAVTNVSAPAVAVEEELPVGEFPHESIADAPVAVPLFSKEGLIDVADSAVQALDNVSFVYLAAIILGILFLVSLLVALFRRGASTQLAKEENVTPILSIDLQPAIDSMVAKGYNYTQVEQWLVQNRYDKSVVDSEIRKNYQKRIELQGQKK
jgi:hypothetical protein